MTKYLIIFILIANSAFARVDINPHVTDYVKALDGDVSLVKKWAAVLKKQPIEEGENNLKSLKKVWQAVTGKYISDSQNYAEFWVAPGTTDYWATPAEFKKKGGGDCEDFAIAWYYAARKQGFAASQLNLWVGYLPERDNMEHMVLAIDFKGKEYVFDNFSNKILPADKYMQKKFKLMYRFNETGWSVD